MKKPISIGVIDVTNEPKLGRVLRYLILQQNTLQKTFEFVFLPKPEEVNILKQLQNQKEIESQHIEKLLSEFTPKYEKWLQAQSEGWELPEIQCDHYVFISTLRFSEGYYTIGDDLWDLIALGDWDRYMSPPSIVEFIIVLLLNCAVEYSLDEDNIPSHYETKGCLFDFTEDITDLRYGVLTGFICKSCEKQIIKARSIEFYNDVNLLLKREWLGTTDKPSEVSNTLKKMGYNLFRTMGIRPSLKERISLLLEGESIKALFALIGGLLLGYLASNPKSKH